MSPSEYLDILCNTADGVFITDAHKRIVRWNRGAERILGYPESETLNRSCFQVIAGTASGAAAHCGQDCAIHRHGIDGTPQENFDLQVRTRAGLPVWVNVTLLSGAGTVTPFITHILRDVTCDRRRILALDQFISELKSSGCDSPCMTGSRAAGGGAVPSRKPQDGPPLPALSAREIEVLTLLAEGLSTKGLAQRLDISHFTARNHIQNILVKLDLHSKAQAVSFAFKQGIL